MSTEEMNHIAAQWEKTHLLDGVSKERKGQVAVALENQRLHNQAIIDSLSEGEQKSHAQFHRLSIPLVRRALPGINVQVGITRRDEDFHYETLAIEPWNAPEYHVTSTLDAEANYTSLMACTVAAKLKEVAQAAGAGFRFYCLGVEEGVLVMYFDILEDVD